MDDTLRSTSDQGISIVIFQTYASQNTVSFATFSVWTASDSITRFWFIFDYRTMSEWITMETLRTRANRIVIDYRAHSVYSTNSWTWVLTFVAYTRLIECTVSVRQTFGSTLRIVIRIRSCAWITQSDIVAVNVAHIIGSTRIGMARLRGGICDGQAMDESIAHITIQTRARSRMVGNATLSVYTAYGTNTGILTSFIDTTLALWTIRV